MKIRTKLFLLTFAAVLVLTFMLVTMYVRSSTVLKDIATDDALAMVTNEIYALNIYLDGLKRIVDTALLGVAVAFDQEGNFSEETLMTLLTRLSETNNVHFYIGVEST